MERFDILKLEYIGRLGMITWSMQVLDHETSVVICDKIPLWQEIRGI